MHAELFMSNVCLCMLINPNERAVRLCVLDLEFHLVFFKCRSAKCFLKSNAKTNILELAI